MREPVLGSTVPHVGLQFTVSGEQAPVGQFGLLCYSGPLTGTLEVMGRIVYQNPATLAMASFFSVPTDNWSISLSVPNAPSMAGVRLVLQAGFLSAGGVETTQAVEVVIGP